MNYIKTCFTLICFCIIRNNYAQPPLWFLFDKNVEKPIYFKPEYTYQKQHYMSVGIGYLTTFNVIYDIPMMLSGISLNADVLLSNKNWHFIPKLSYEYHVVFVAAKLNFGIPTDFKSHCLLFSPEIGITGFGFFYVFYGYNFINQNIYNIGHHKITVGINWYQNHRFRDFLDGL